MKKSCFSILSDNQKYLLCIPTFFDRSKDFKIKVRKEYKHYYILENGDKISKVKGKLSVGLFIQLVCLILSIVKLCVEF